MEDKKFNIEISTNSIFKVLIILFVLWFAYIIRDIILILFISLILVSILEPTVSWLHNRKIPRAIGVLGIYFILLGLLVLIFILFVPPITAQAEQLSQNFNLYWDRLVDVFQITDTQLKIGNVQKTLEYLNAQLPQATGGLFSTVSGILGGVFSFFLVLVITFYFLVEESGFKKILRFFTPSHYQPYIYRLVNRIQGKMGLWIRGQLILSFIVFVFVYIGLLLLQVPYALLLAILAGVLEFIPYIGPIVSGFVAVLLTIFTSPIKALLIIALYFVIQQVENHILVPKIMQRTIGLNPVISIVALLVGVRLGGIIGVILAIPVVTALSVFVQDFVNKDSDDEKHF